MQWFIVYNRYRNCLIIFNQASHIIFLNNHYFWLHIRISDIKMEEITEIFLAIIDQSPSVDIAEAEFKRRLVDEPELRRLYREYCQEEGVSERRGFLDFCEAYIDGQNEMWNSLDDFDNQE